MNTLIIIGTIFLSISAATAVIGGVYMYLGNKQDSDRAHNEVLSTVNKEGDSTRETVVLEGKHSRQNSDNNAQKLMEGLQEMNKKFSPLLSQNDPSKHDDTFNFTFDKAFNLTGQNKFSDAIVLWDLLIENYAADYIVLNNKGVTLSKLGKDEDAVSWYSKSIDVEPSSEAFNNRAWMYINLGKFPQALQDCNTAIDLNLESRDLYHTKGLALVGLNRYEDAFNAYSKSIDIKPSPKAFGDRAKVYYQFEKFIEAIQDCNAAIKLDPDFVFAYRLRSIAYGSLEKFDNALQDCNIVIELEPKVAGNYSNRALVFEKKGQYDEAFKDYEKAIKLDPNFAHSYVNRGVLYFNTGEYSKALNDYNKAIELGANNVVFANRARVKYELDDKSGACEDINKAVEMGAQVPSEIIAKYCDQ